MTASPDTGRTRLPRVHLVTDDEIVSGRRFLDGAAELLEAGGPRVALHLRARSVTGRRLFQLGERLARLAGETGAWLFVNDRVDVALACGAHGVQLGVASFPPAGAERLLGAGKWIGASVHGLSEATAAVHGGADFLLAGTLYPSRSHPGRPATGTGWLRAAAGLDRPVIGIGGVTPERAHEVLRDGGYGVAIIRGVWGAERPVAALGDYLSATEIGHDG